MQQNSFNKFVWSIFALAIILPFIAWSAMLGWDYSTVDLYTFFPLLGITAWMIMWTHFVSGAVRIRNPHLKKPAYYSKVSGYLVLAAILLHPGILALAQYQNEAGLPPASFFSYLGDSARIAVLYGSISLLVFLSFEFFDRMRHKQWVKQANLWISLSQSAAMILIFIHGLRIGPTITGWFVYVWLLFGAVLLPCMYIIHENDLKQRRALKVDEAKVS
jgi:hypothetical protein